MKIDGFLRFNARKASDDAFSGRPANGPNAVIRSFTMIQFAAAISKMPGF
jgi:hypothetical protein